MKINREELLNDLATVRAGLSQREFLEQSSCLSADTIIHTLAGDFTIATLMAQGKKEFLVYSTDGSELKIGRAFGLRKTKSNAKVYRIVFDTGDVIKLTADHLVMMRDGSYKPVAKLQIGGSVMPFNYRWDSVGYRRIYPHIVGKSKRAHCWVMEQFLEESVKLPFVIHHKDENTDNNDPDNLEVMLREDHSRYHSLKNPPMHKPGAAEAVSKALMGNQNGIGPKPGTALAMLGNKHGIGGPGNTSPRTKKQLETSKRNWAIMCSKRWLGKELSDNPINVKRRARRHAANNHKIVSIDYVGREDVYDLSVYKYHNFAANGIFVHNCFVFTDGHVITFNDEISCRKKVDLGITGAVQAAPLISILEKMDDEDLEVCENEKGELEFKGKRKAFGITKESDIHLPVDKVEQPTKWRDLSKEFTEAIGLTKHCVSTDESNFKLCCIHLAPEWVESCDNLQILRVSIKTGLKRSVLVRGTSIGHIVSLAMDKIALTESWIHFKNQEGLVFSCRRHTEEYHPLDKILQFKGHPIVIPKGLAETAERAAVFAMDKAGDPLCEVRLKDGVIRITGRGLSGWFKEVRKVSYDGPPMEFVIAPELLKHISENYQDAQITKTKLKVEGGSWIYCSVLGQPKEEEETEDTED